MKKIMLLGSGELGKEFVIAAQRLGQTVVACDSYAGAPAMQVADACEVFHMLDGDALAAAVGKHRPDIIVPEIEAIRTERLYEFEKAGVQVTLNLTSTWKELPISGWEMCKVLSNLIDNAIDAMADLPNGKKHLTITLTENLKEYVFSVANTGTPIAPDDQQRIFEPGVTTKSDGHGMGLFIVRETLRHYGGDIQVTSDAQETVFSGTVPKDTTIPEAKAAQENSTNA